ncbi:MAG: molecular chaperone HtpG [Gammaproteobacteria bacterium TMED119]|nr:MAG: molecular chaperone HtpG [Gammaproteobacteria bacterium TMED119]RCL46407.1 MAG: molecular chaperone HtpG [Candidatus Thioglobus sp.]
MSANTKQTLKFESEVSQVLQLMIHSLYSNKEIFLRELISNASDACDKLRFESLANADLLATDTELKIQVEYDKDNNTLTVRDNGIGMTRAEVINNIGTIAKSGTKEFLQNLTGDAAKDSNLIGQFGVGFYSAFIVADRVELKTRSATQDAEQGVLWSSQGTGEYDLEDITFEPRGTEITLHLKDEEQELLSGWRLRSIISKYSDHIPLPIEMFEEDDKGELTDTLEVINKASALWTRSKSDISTEEYNEFYKHVGHDFEDPLAWSHSRVEGKTEYTSLLYIPSKAPYDLYEPKQTHGLKLYVQRVFIMEDADKLLPRYLRFARGVIDSNDLPLNVSREILQSNKVIDSIRSGSVKKLLGVLDKMANNEPEKYQSFWQEFGRVMKEGPAEDFANKEQIAGLLRFSSTATDQDQQDVSLADYIARMGEQQESIYYITADNFKAAKNSPHLEIFRKKGIEVLLMSDRVDEWLMGSLTEFEGKTFVSVAKGELDLDKFSDSDEKEAHKQTEQDAADIVKQIKDSLADKVEDVRVSHRLTSSPACVVLNEHDMALYMQHLLKQAGQQLPETKPVLEINPQHPLVMRMQDEADMDQVKEWSTLLFEQAILAEGGQLENPAEFVSRLNKIIVDFAA